MHTLGRGFFVGLVGACLISTGIGCKKAGRFGMAEPSHDAKPAKLATEKPAAPEVKKRTPLSADFAWMVPGPDALEVMESEVPIRFVQRDKEPESWARLDKFWTLVKTPRTPLGKERQEARIKVPVGLADPTPYIPAANAPTVGKWALGKKLFFDTTYLWPASMDAQSCATCHIPARGFTEGGFAGPDKMRVPSLFNVVYNRYLFWDGRVSALEQVVQRTLEDEREPTSSRSEPALGRAERLHKWSGVVKRLRASKSYTEFFKKVFGTPPTQDNIGKALATYLRTFLVGGSLYDQAQLAAKGKVPFQDQYAKLLDADALKALRREAGEKDKVADEIFRGYRIFHGQGRCADCHKGANFTDDGFHNAGIRESKLIDPAHPVGRFVSVPPGLKDRRLLGAFKTPTLRGLPQTAPYFHDGSAGVHKDEDAVIEAVMKHVKQEGYNPYLDPGLRDLKMPESDVRAVALFLRCLDGAVDPMVADPEKWPDGAKR